MYKIIMPSGGQTTDESVISGWKKKVGDKIGLGDILFEIETDKTVLEVESYCKGYLRAVKYGDGETAAAGETVAYIGEIDESIPEWDDKNAGVIIAAREENAVRPEIKTVETERILASPLAKKTARGHGIDLKDIAPNIDINIIKKQDVLNYISQSKKPTEQNSYVSYYTVGVDVDMTSCIIFLDRLNDYFGNGEEITVIDMIIKCADKIAGEFFLINSVAVSDFGMFGVDCFASVIKRPESCVLAIGAIKEKAVSVNREIISRDMMNITASFDRCATDGETGAKFISEIKKLLESPELFVLIMAK